MRLLRLFSFLIFFVPSLTLAQELPASSGVWNGFNQHSNVVECTNLAAPGTFTLTMLNSAAKPFASVPFYLNRAGTSHVILDSFGIENRYGVYSVKGPHDQIRCITSTYRAGTAKNSPFDYAFAMPSLQMLNGSSYGLYNSFNAAGTGPVTYNWLSVINASEKSLSGEVKTFDATGQLSRTVPINSLEPGARIDLALGHEQGMTSGVYQIDLADPAQKYHAFVTRYGRSESRYEYAFTLEAAPAHCNVEPLHASTMGDAYNWAEIANPLNESAAVTAQVFSSSGTALSQPIELNIPPRGQHHLPLHEYLGPSNLGTLHLKCKPGTKGILADTVFYGRSEDKTAQIDWAYVSQAKARLIAGNSSALMHLNTFLGAANWLKVMNATGSEEQFQLGVFDASGDTSDVSTRALRSFAATDIGVHSTLGPNSVGSAIAVSPDSKSTFSAELLRVYSTGKGRISYIMNIPSLSLAQAQVKTACSFQMEQTVTVLPGNERSFAPSITSNCKGNYTLNVLRNPQKGELFLNASAGIFRPQTNFSGSDTSLVRVCVIPESANTASTLCEDKILTFQTCELSAADSQTSAVENTVNDLQLKVKNTCGIAATLASTSPSQIGKVLGGTNSTAQYQLGYAQGTDAFSFRVCIEGLGCSQEARATVRVDNSANYRGNAESLAPYREHITNEERQHLVRKAAANALWLLGNGGLSMPLSRLLQERVVNERYFHPETATLLRSLQQSQTQFYATWQSDEFIKQDPAGPAAGQRAVLFNNSWRFDTPEQVDDGVKQWLAVTARERHGLNFRYHWTSTLMSSYLLFQARQLSPIRAKMLHFWLGHFGTASHKINGFEEHLPGHYIWNLQKHALKNFRDVILGDPARCYQNDTTACGVANDSLSMHWLDNQLNRKTSPNENFPREVLELYLLGPRSILTGANNYTDTNDVAAFTRFLSGYAARTTNNGIMMNVAFNPNFHETAPQTMFSELASLNPSLPIRNRSMLPDQAVRHIIDNHPGVSEYIARQLFAYFVYPDPSDSLVEELAHKMREVDFDITAFLKIILRSEAMFSPRAKALDCVRSPVESMMSMINGLELPLFMTQLDNPDPSVNQFLLFRLQLDPVMSAAGEHTLGYPTVFAYDYCGERRGVDGTEEWAKSGKIVNRIRAFTHFLSYYDEYFKSFELADIAARAARAGAQLSVDEFISYFEVGLSLSLTELM